MRLAEERAVPPGQVTLRELAARTGWSRSTVVRRLGGSRQALDDALCAAGVESERPPSVRERALEAVAETIAAKGLAAVTFERIASVADCSVHSLYAVFGCRDELLGQAFERFGPVPDVTAALGSPRPDLEATVRRVYQALVTSLEREPRVLPAILAEVFARPGDPQAKRFFEQAYPRLLGGIGRWLSEEIAAGRIRELPLLLLTQQMTGPVVLHFLMRPAAEQLPGHALPPKDETVEVFTQGFLRAVRIPS